MCVCGQIKKQAGSAKYRFVSEVGLGTSENILQQLYKLGFVFLLSL